MERNEGTTRRAFIATIGAAAAATAVPVTVQAAVPRTWGEVPGIRAALLAAYLGEIARFAETLRPRFEAGELRAFRDDDDRDVFRRADGIPDSPQWEVERLVRGHFGLEVTKTPDPDGGLWFEGDDATARLILAASPHAESAGRDGGWTHVCHEAADAATWDVIVHARAEGWYTPRADECEDPAAECAA